MPPRKKPSVNIKKKKPTVQRKADKTPPPLHDQIAEAAEERPIAQDAANSGLDTSHPEDVNRPVDRDQGETSILQHLRNQDDHINRLSNTVDELRKTMGEMSESLKKLVNETHQRPSSAAGASSGDQFDLVTSLLREMRSKDDKFDRLQLQNEVLTLKVRHLEERQSESHGSRLSAAPQNPAPENIGRTGPMSIKVPLRGSDDGDPRNPIASHAAPIQQQFPEVQVTVPVSRGRQAKRRSTGNLGSRPATDADPEKPSGVEPPAKKPRRYSTKDPVVAKGSAADQRASSKRGRSLPRPSSSTSNLSTATTAKEDHPEQATAPETQRRRRSERSSTRMSRRPSLEPAAQASQQVIPASDGTDGEEQGVHDQLTKESEHDEQERLRKEQIAARDRLVEQAMRREEAMDMT